MAKTYQELIKKIEKDGIKTDEFVRLISHIGEFNLTDSKEILNTLIQIHEMRAANGWKFSVAGYGVVKETVFDYGERGIPTAGIKGEGALTKKKTQKGVRIYFALGDNITDKARQRVRKE